MALMANMVNISNLRNDYVQQFLDKFPHKDLFDKNIIFVILLSHIMDMVITVLFESTFYENIVVPFTSENITSFITSYVISKNDTVICNSSITEKIKVSVNSEVKRLLKLKKKYKSKWLQHLRANLSKKTWF